MFGLSLWLTLLIAYVLGYCLTVYTVARVDKPADGEDKTVIGWLSLLYPIWTPPVLIYFGVHWLLDAGDRANDAGQEEAWEKLTNRMIRDKVLAMLKDGYETRRIIRELARDEAQQVAVEESIARHRAEAKKRVDARVAKAKKRG